MFIHAYFDEYVQTKRFVKYLYENLYVLLSYSIRMACF